MTTETDFTRLMLDAQGDPHCLALLIESTRAELLDVARDRDQVRAEFARLVAEHAQTLADVSAEAEAHAQCAEMARSRCAMWKSRFDLLARVAGPCFDVYLDAFGAFSDVALNESTRKERQDVTEMVELLKQLAE